VEHLSPEYNEIGKEQALRQQQWQEIEAEVQRLADRLGRPIDEHIRAAVVGLRANGFGTTGSCEGHADRAYPYPWIDVESPISEAIGNDPRYRELGDKFRNYTKGGPALTPAEMKEGQRLQQTMIEENEKAFQRVVGMLKEFYETRLDNPLGSKFTLSVLKGPRNDARIQPASGVPFGVRYVDAMKSWSEQEKRANLQPYRDEMNKFSDFLRSKFLSVLPRQPDSDPGNHYL